MRSERGATAVEMVLVAPILVTLIHLIITAAMAFTAQALVQWGADRAARAAAVPVDPFARTYLDEAGIAAAVSDVTPMLELPDDAVSVTFADARRGEGARFTVEVRYPWRNPIAAVVREAMTAQSARDAVVFTATATGVRE